MIDLYRIAQKDEDHRKAIGVNNRSGMKAYDYYCAVREIVRELRKERRNQNREH